MRIEPSRSQGISSLSSGETFTTRSARPYASSDE